MIHFEGEEGRVCCFPYLYFCGRGWIFVFVGMFPSFLRLLSFMILYTEYILYFVQSNVNTARYTLTGTLKNFNFQYRTRYGMI